MALINRARAKLLLIAGAVLFAAAIGLAWLAADWGPTPTLTVVLFIVGGLKLALGLGYYVMNPMGRSR